MKSSLKYNTAKPETTGPDLMEFYPENLIKEYPEIEIDIVKPSKIKTMKAAINLTNNPINNYFKWN